MNLLPSISLSVLLACASATPHAYSYTIYDADIFGYEGGKEIQAGYYYVTKDTVYFKMRDYRQTNRSNRRRHVVCESGLEYEDYDHKAIKEGQRVYLVSADFALVAQIRSKSGKKLYIQLKDVVPEKEYEALLKEKQEAELVLEKWNEVKTTLAPCPQQGNACAIENTPAFKHRSDIINFLSIKDNDNMRQAFAKNQIEKETAIMLAPAQVINIILWESSDDHEFVKIVSESGDVLYAAPTHLRALPKKETEK